MNAPLSSLGSSRRYAKALLGAVVALSYISISCNLTFAAGPSEAGPFPYAFIPSTGTLVPGTTVVNRCDDCTTEIALPFAVALYDQTFSNVRINSNGALEFNNDLDYYANDCLPAPSFTYAIFPYWDDLVTDRNDAHGVFVATYGTAPHRVFVIEWRASPFNDFDGTRPANFEVLFYEGKPYFEMVYGQLPDAGEFATVGLQRDSSAYSQYFCNEIVLVPGLRLLVMQSLPPNATNDSVTVSVNNPAMTINVLANDRDPLGDALTVTGVTAPSHGNATVAPDGSSVSYTPSFDYVGADSFTYGITNMRGASASATVNVLVINHDPTARDDAATVSEDGVVAISVLSNDDCAPDFNETLRVISVGSAAHGSIYFTTTSIEYTAATNYFGSDSFTYAIGDGHGGSAVARVTLTILPINDNPVANDDAVLVDEDGSVIVNVLANDTSLPDVGETLTITGTGTASHGNVSFTAAQVTYTPLPNYFGADSFAYTISDGHGGTATATVNVTVRSVNDNPAANSDTATVNQDSSITIDVLANDSFAPDAGETLSVISAGPAAHGTVSFGAAGVAYTPALHYSGQDFFSYTISDGNGGVATATVSVTVVNVNTPPDVTLAVPFGLSLNENDSVTLNGSVIDPDAQDTHTVVIDWGDGSAATTLQLAAGVSSFSSVHQYLDDQPTLTPSDVNLVVVTVTDSKGATAQRSVGVTVLDVAPAITSVVGPAAPIALGTAVSISVGFTDVGSQDTHVVRISWDDGSPDSLVTTGGYLRSASHMYAAAGVYTIGITVTDDDQGSATTNFAYAVVYDVAAGFVTGGGWFDSAPGAVIANPSAQGRAKFGFNAKYGNNGVPVGETEFHLNFAKFTFKSTSYQWFVVSENKAQCAGVGRINGSGTYGFLLAAIDGNSTTPDQMRMKIWNPATGAVIYDSGLGASDDFETATGTPLGGGDIVVHRKN